MKKVVLKIDGMTCSACSSGLEKYLNKQEGVKVASVNLIMNNAVIEYDDKKIDLNQVEKYIEKAIKSVLMQKVNFNMEVLIGEDCSTDHTREI